MSQSIIDVIREENPFYDPLSPALEKAGVSRELWNAATQRIYTDGMYGPIHPIEWAEQDGREPYIVSDAIEIVAKVLEEVDDYWEMEFCEEGTTEAKCTGHCIWESKVDADDIKAELVFWYREIYGVRYPQL